MERSNTEKKVTSDSTAPAGDSEHRDSNAFVLVVEDLPVNQRVAQLMLEKLGCKVDLAADGLEALKCLSMRKYDLVLMDCQMPELDGFEATSRFREQELGANGRTPIIAMTAHTLPEDHERCLAAGMDAFISKPVTMDLFRAVLKRWHTDQVS